MPAAGMRIGIGHSALLMLLAALLFLVAADRQSIWSKSIEGMRAEVVREMVDDNEWWLPMLNGEPYIAKPPLYFWAAAWASRALGGVTEFSCRIPSIISAILCVGLVIGVGTLLFGRLAGFFAGIILALNPLYLTMATAINLDMLLTLLTTASAACFVRSAIAEGRLQNNSFLFGFVFMALAILTKGPVGFMVPASVLAGLLCVREWRLNLRHAPWLLGAIALLTLVVPWGAFVISRVPNVWATLYQETFFRYEAGSLQAGKPWYSYIYMLAVGFLPWTIFVPLLVFACIRAWREERLRSRILLLAFWFAPSFFIFSCTSTKRLWYLLPLFPVLALLSAWLLSEWAHSRLTPVEEKMGRRLFAFGGAILLILGCAMTAAAFYFAKLLDASQVLLIAMLIMISGILILRGVKIRALNTALSALAMSVTAVWLLWTLVLLRVVDPYRTRKEFFRSASQIAKEAALVNYRFNGFDLQFYSARVVPFVQHRDELKQRFQSGENALAVVEEKNLHDLSDLPHRIVLEQSWANPLGGGAPKKLYLIGPP